MLVYHEYCSTDQPEMPTRPHRAQRRRWQREAQATGPNDLQRLIRDGVEGFSDYVGLQNLQARMEAEAEELAGAPKGKHDPERKGYRHSDAAGSIVVGGQKVAVRRPRVRSTEGKGELQLPTYQAAQDPKFLDEVVMRSLLSGITQRDYKGSLRVPPDELPSSSTSKSAVGRRFVEQTQQMVEELLSRPLDDTRYLAVYLDGVEEGGHHILVAMGLSETGEKRILGMWEGSSENAEVCRELLQDLMARGLDVSRGLLAVIDGSPALAAAIQAVWGDQVQVQRCQLHKARNLTDKLPKNEHTWVRRKLRSIWDSDDPIEAQKSLEALADELEARGRQEAAASLREGMAETLTALKLGVAPSLRCSLTNTNPLESAFSAHESLATEVKRWRNGRQVLRWVAAGLLRAEASFRRNADREALAALGEALHRRARGRGQAASASAA